MPERRPPKPAADFSRAARLFSGLFALKADGETCQSVMAAVCDPAGFTGVSRCRAAGLVLKSLFPGFRGDH